MTYDDAEWHCDSVSEFDLPGEAAGTHIGIFMAWLVLHDLASPEYAQRGWVLHARTSTPGEFLFASCCGQIDPGMLTVTGNAFIDDAYRAYLRMYDNIPEVAIHDNMYAAPDTWQLYDAVAQEIDGLFQEWVRYRGG
ncbi:hypothetical protein GV791_06905 [Nocardia cyriacigeorgica]|uniref:DUF7832 domain-containing protein n=3 Tax=Nocardia TaxID=1817 RepID=H6QYC0_NOCCG|nr:hypothetical protein [Nocardia cyriacigeorgica]MBF6286812.1 hypothetical protein [Nocardia cyriacigeorgica]NEW32291.1 hypothetical protein [Nocardia cyriacigeorgica]BDU05857.1 hypothetical protein FMUBM48_21200 [Nocardia cyriacigeorgica]CCF62766.1 protein of unknown function [Nocardia cyriacigeorgica GUH-2]